ncbi:hypothetical protein JGU71_07605 [Antrihabitans sp. YC3-6]|uniref:WXG100 family type VII secretion target n=1 Tax=Antrihabitans stalagmiti TaxID=2799499 RepID=A0A934U3A7_9NOCA|nr:hypothetical protein [Antrihabitans stalagmiti]MBJ8338748.1 hypothetical protein [Antrihabitans stalagmiti]
MAHGYDLPTMERFVAELDGRISSLIEINNAVRHSATTTKSDFDGDGGDSFWTGNTDWHRQTDELLDELRALRARVQGCYDNYTEAHRVNCAMFA